MSSFTSFLASAALTYAYYSLRRRQEARVTVPCSCDEELLLRITTCLAQNGYHTEVGIMVQVSKAFRDDEQIWDAFKDVPGASGRTRLMYASHHGLVDRVNWLLSRGARVDLPSSSPHTPSITNQGFTALIFASAAGHPAVVRALIARGASANSTALLALSSTPGSTIECVTALMLASGMGHLDVVSELIKGGALIAPDLADHSFSPLMWASQKGHLEVVRELCARGANVDAARSSDGFTALMCASQDGHLEVVRELCKRGVNVNAARTGDGFTALMCACLHGHLEIVRELCEKGVNVNASMSIRGWTALMLAGFEGHLEAAIVLCDRGANVDASLGNGVTVLMLCLHLPRIVTLLLQRGATDPVAKRMYIRRTRCALLFSVSTLAYFALVQAAIRKVRSFYLFK